MPIALQSTRLELVLSDNSDSREIYDCITPAITRFMAWEPPNTFDEFYSRRASLVEANGRSIYSFVVRRKTDRKCIGVVAIEDLDNPSPEIGIWLEELSHGKGFGREAIMTLIDWASRYLKASSFRYPVAKQNLPSRRIAEFLGGVIVGKRQGKKYDSVIYLVPAIQS